MIIYIILLLTLLVVAAVMLFVLVLNRAQVKKSLYYQYNYIPEPLIRYVKVDNLKYD
jgi:flagellar basal body-associated protein FliL